MTAGAHAVAKAAFDPVAHYLAAFDALAGAGPHWLAPLREKAAAQFGEQGFPNPKDEEWRATNPSPLTERPFSPAPRPTLAQARQAARAAGLGEPRGARLLLVDGAYFGELSSPLAHPAAIAGSLAVALQSSPAWLEGLLSRASGRSFTALNTAFLSDGAFVFLPQGVSLEEPVEIVHLALAGSAPCLIQPRTLIVAESASGARVVERYLAAGDGPYFTNAVTQIAAGDGAWLEHYRVEAEARSALHVGEVEVRQGRGARVSAFSFSAGTALVRNDVGVRLEAPGARSSLFGLSVTTGAQLVDNHTRVVHASPNCTSEESYRAILDGASKAVFRGRIDVHEGAQKTDAAQSNKSLLLSEDATASAKPQLMICADDVKCTHGASVGQLDKEAAFYLRSRGIGEGAARAILTRAFAGHIIEKVKLDWLRAELEERLFHGIEVLQGS